MTSRSAGRMGAWLFLVTLAGALGGCPAPENKPRGTAVYVTMRDGTRIAIDVWLPAGLAADAKVPTVMRMTRYWRAAGLVNYDEADDGAAYEAGFYNARGYAWVSVDARGTGASFGVSTSPWSAAELADYGEVVDWVIAQTWSNGRVGADGISYEGNTALLLSALGHPAVKAVVPRFFDFDPYAAPAMPGGIFDDNFIRAWTASNDAQDRNDLCAMAALAGIGCNVLKSLITGPKPVDADTDGSLLAAALAEHAANTDVYAALKAITYRDDPFDAQGVTMAAISPYSFGDAISAGQTPWYSWASWLDAGTADGALAAYATCTNPQKVIIGPWSHGAAFDADPFHAADAAVAPTEQEQFDDFMAFFDTYLKADVTIEPAREIKYYTLGEGVWRTTSVWPPAGTTRQTWYFREGNTLQTEWPDAVEVSDTYTVDFTATTGTANRWQTQKNGGDVVYGDRAAEDGKLLTYTTAPLAVDLRIVGHPVVLLYVSSTATDGAFYVYLEDVGPDGVVTYLTEGELRGLHRAVSGHQPPYKQFGPYHSFAREEGRPLLPGELTELRFKLQPTAALVRAGHRLRVAIAGHDADTFVRIPAEGDVSITVRRDGEFPSGVEIPVAGQ
jgi:putative CocE/NonD family hydrolase